MNPQLIAFLMLAVATLGGALICLWSRYVVHSAFGLMLSLLGVAGLYVLLDSDFLAITQIVIYVGGVVVLYLFGVMLTPPDMEERSTTRISVLAGISGVALVGLLTGIASSATNGVLATPLPPRPQGTIIREVGRQFLGKDQYLLPFEVASILLLVALVGAVFIARRSHANEDHA